MNAQPTWKLRPLFLGCLAIACVSAVVQWQFVGEQAMFIPLAVFLATFILPNLIFPNRVRLDIDDAGVTYSDFSQHIYAPWTYVTGYKSEPDTSRVDVFVRFPRANFSVRTSHPKFELLRRKLEEHGKSVV